MGTFFKAILTQGTSVDQFFTLVGLRISTEPLDQPYRSYLVAQDIELKRWFRCFS